MRAWHKALVILALCLAACCGCSATAQVSVAVRPNGTGTVSVTVTLDKAASATVGGMANQLKTADLAAAGWTIKGPVAAPNGSSSVTVSKPFSTLSQAASILQQVAGTGAPSSRPFQLAISHQHSFWTTTTRATGAVNLRCGLSCFGDPGLAKALGYPTGINPAAAGRDPSKMFHFQMALRLPGTVQSTNAAARGDGELRWTPRLGADTPLSAVTEQLDVAHVVAAAVAGGAGLVLVAGLGVWLPLRRWRRRRHTVASSELPGPERHRPAHARKG